jgi:hypothetical protein
VPLPIRFRSLSSQPSTSSSSLLSPGFDSRCTQCRPLLHPQRIRVYVHRHTFYLLPFPPHIHDAPLVAGGKSEPLRSAIRTHAARRRDPLPPRYIRRSLAPFHSSITVRSNRNQTHIHKRTLLWIYYLILLDLWVFTVSSCGFFFSETPRRVFGCDFVLRGCSQTSPSQNRGTLNLPELRQKNCTSFPMPPNCVLNSRKLGQDILTRLTRIDAALTRH